jgi:hypothetical protein
VVSDIFNVTVACLTRPWIGMVNLTRKALVPERLVVLVNPLPIQTTIGLDGADHVPAVTAAEYDEGYLPFIQDWADGTQFRWYAALGSHLDSLLGYAHGRHLLVPTRGQIARDHLFRGSIHLH